MNGAPNNIPGLWDRIARAFDQSLGFKDVTKIAEAVGLSYQSVYKWQKGLLPSIEALLKIKDLTNSSIDWLLTGEEAKSSDHGQIILSLSWEGQQEAIRKLAEHTGQSIYAQIDSLIVSGLAEASEHYRGVLNLTPPPSANSKKSSFRLTGTSETGSTNEAGSKKLKAEFELTVRAIVRAELDRRLGKEESK